jgi:hypothetical protein
VRFALACRTEPSSLFYARSVHCDEVFCVTMSSSCADLDSTAVMARYSGEKWVADTASASPASCPSAMAARMDSSQNLTCDLRTRTSQLGFTSMLNDHILTARKNCPVRAALLLRDRRARSGGESHMAGVRLIGTDNRLARKCCAFKSVGPLSKLIRGTVGARNVNSS